MTIYLINIIGLFIGFRVLKTSEMIITFVIANPILFFGSCGPFISMTGGYQTGLMLIASIIGMLV